MDIAKLQQTVEGIRSHLAAGDKEAAIALYGESFAVDRQAAERAVAQIAAGDPSGLVGQILQAVPGGRMAGTVLRFAGFDLTKIAAAAMQEGEGTAKTFQMTLPTMRLPGAAPNETPTPPLPPAAPAANLPERPPLPAAPPRRPHNPTVERPRGFGIVGLAALLVGLIAAAAAAVILLRQG